MKNNFYSNLKYDIPSGLVVFLVAVPLCLGIALASGAPLFSGIIAGMAGGIVVTLFSGSALGVSGPAAGLAAIVLAGIQSLGAFEHFLMAVVIAGILQFILGVARAGIIAYYFPSAVIKGMLAGIGIIIFLKQIPHAFGYDTDSGRDLGFIQVNGENVLSESLHMINFITPGALLIAAISMIILILWEQKFIRKFKITQAVQGPLVVVITGILLAAGFADTSLGIRNDLMVSIPVADHLAGFVNQFTLPDFRALAKAEVWVLGITMAIVASLETLLCVEATDKLDPQKRVTPTSRELRAQGIGNVVSGLIGGLPVTQVIVRSSANIQSGGKTKMAALFHGILIFISALLIPNLLNKIPLSSLAAILLVVGYKLAKPSLFREMWASGHAQFVPFVVTVVAIVFSDLLKGIGIGMGVAIFYILLNNLKNPYVLREIHDTSKKHYRIILAEMVTFLNKAQILKELNRIPNDAELLIDASKTQYIQHDVLEIINDFKNSAQYKNITFKMYCMEQLNLKDYEPSLRELMITEEQFSQITA